MINHLHDKEFTDYTIKEVRTGKIYHDISTTDSCGFCLEKKYGIVPQAGQTVRVFGEFGRPIRGIALDGKVVFYRTLDEQHELDRKNAQAADAKKRRWFNLNRTRLDRRVRRLPKHFRQRILRFRNNNPDFRWESEPYELFCCEQAVVIAGTLGNENRCIEFCKADWNTQRKMVPGLDDGHSGNTFAVASGLATLHFSKQALVVRSHGALCPLVGCVGYGCVPKEGGAK